MTQSEIQQIKNDTIQNLIKSNRELKLNYQRAKEQVAFSKKSIESTSNEFSAQQWDTHDFDAKIKDLQDRSLNEINKINSSNLNFQGMFGAKTSKID